MTQYSLQMYTLREFMKTPEALDRTLSRIAEMGYENVQITPPAFTTAVLSKRKLRRFLSSLYVMMELPQLPEAARTSCSAACALISGEYPIVRSPSPPETECA